MREYAICVFVICAVISGGSMLSYGKHKTMEKCAIGLLLLYIIIAPVADYLKQTDFPNFEYQEEMGELDGGYEEISEEAFKEGISDAVCQKFSIDKKNIRVLIEDFDFSTMSCSKIRIFLSGRGVFTDYKAIESYVNEMNLGECECEIEIG